jgi:hypothetical protein
VEEIAAMRTVVSPSTRQRYPLTMVCQVWRVARSSVYAAATLPARPAPASKRGPKTVVSDEQLVTAVRRVGAHLPVAFAAERRLRERLVHRGLAVSGKRVLRLMRQHQLLAQRRLGPPNGDPAHAGRIITTRPNEMSRPWGRAVHPPALRYILVVSPEVSAPAGSR